MRLWCVALALGACDAARDATSDDAGLDASPGCVERHDTPGIERRTEGAPCGTTCVVHPRGDVCESAPGGSPDDGVCRRELGLRCDEPSRACQPTLTQGQPCEGYLQCAAELRCHEGRCAPLGDDGEACDPFAIVNPCASTARCSTDGRCTPPLSPGEPCTRYDQCDPAASCVDGRCEAHPEPRPYCR